MKIANPVARQGENQAVNFLQQKGYKILERNFRKGYGELDIVALEPKTKILVFIEVKTRTSDEFGTPLEAITPWKIKTLVKTAQFYKISHRGLPDALRVDAIAVTINDDGKVGIDHVQNITGF